MAKGSRFAIAAGGCTIRGLKFAPAGEGAASGWTVIMSHGFGSSAKRCAGFSQGLARAGAQVFAFDFPGSGAGTSEGRDSWDMSVLTEAEDLGHVLDWVRGLANVDAARVALAGESQGGLVSALVAASRPDDVARLVMLYPALCIPDDARAGSMLGSVVDPDDPPERFRCLGFVTLGRRYVRDAQALDPWEQICRYEGPTLVVHGTADSIVSVDYAREAARRYADARLVELEGAQHGFPSRRHMDAAVAETVDFLGA